MDATRRIAHLDRFPPQNEECLCTLGQEACELVDQNMLDLVRLLYPYAYAHAVDTRLDQDLFVLIAGDCERVEQHFRGTGRFDLRDIMSF